MDVRTPSAGLALVPNGFIRMARAIARLHKVGSEQGTALVEFAFSGVILLTLVFGVIAMSMAVYSYHLISDAAREGTRYAIVRGSECSTYDALPQCPASASDVQFYVQNLGFPGIRPDQMNVTTTWPNGNSPGNLVQVTVTYTLPLIIPFVPKQTLTMTSTSEMVISD
jgi:Flp pilus assembly protein TadG